MPRARSPEPKLGPKGKTIRSLFADSDTDSDDDGNAAVKTSTRTTTVPQKVGRYGPKAPLMSAKAAVTFAKTITDSGSESVVKANQRVYSSLSDKALTRAEERLLNDVYFGRDGKPGLPFGRDALYYNLRTTYKNDVPTLRQVNTWLSKVEVQQLYRPQRASANAQSFTPVAPWKAVAFDLIDFSKKVPYGFILNFICMFSARMFTRALGDKKGITVAKALESILQQLHREYPTVDNSFPTMAISDRGGGGIDQTSGSGWGFQVTDMLKARKITHRMTLPYAPAQNGKCERAGGVLKKLIAKQAETHGGTWMTRLQGGTDAYNKMYSRTGDISRQEASKLEPGTDPCKRFIETVTTDQDKKKPSVTVTQKTQIVAGDRVRLKIAKGVLDKSSTPGWTLQIFTIKKVVVPRLETAPTRYLVDGKPGNFFYSKSDLQPVDPGAVILAPIPMPKKVTRSMHRADEASTGTFTRLRTEGVARAARLRATGEAERLLDRARAQKARAGLQNVPAAKVPKRYAVDYFVESKGPNVLIKWKGFPLAAAAWEPKKKLQRKPEQGGMGVEAYNRAWTEMKTAAKKSRS